MKKCQFGWSIEISRMKNGKRVVENLTLPFITFKDNKGDRLVYDVERRLAAILKELDEVQQ